MHSFALVAAFQTRQTENQTTVLTADDDTNVLEQMPEKDNCLSEDITDSPTTVLETPPADEGTIYLSDEKLKTHLDEFKDISNGAQKEDIYLKEKTKPAPQGIKQEMHTDKPGKKSKPMIIALIALVVLAGVGVACYFAFFSSSKQQKTAEKTTGQQISASAPREEAVVFGDVENADEKVKTGLGTFWLTDIPEMDALHLEKLNSITLNAAEGGTCTVKGSTVIIDRYGDADTMREDARKAEKKSFIIAKIKLEKGVNTYRLDGTDERVDIVSSDAIKYCPATFGFTDTEDTGVLKYNAHVVATGYHNFCFDSDSTYPDHESLAFRIGYIQE